MNIIEQLKSECEGEITNQISVALNEPIDRVKQAIEGSTSGIFLAYLKRATSESGLYLLYNILHDKENPFSKIPTDNLSVDKWLKLAEEGNNYMSKIIPDKKSPLITFLSSQSGVKNISANKINGFANLLVLNKLREAIGENNNDMGPLAEYFNINKDELIEKGPQKMINKLVQILGLNGYLNINKNVLSPTPIKNSKLELDKAKKQEGNKIKKDQALSEEREGTGKNWVIPAIFIGVLGLMTLGYYLFQNKDKYFGSSASDSDSLVNVVTADTLIQIKQDSLLKVKQDSTNLADSLSKIKSNTASATVKLPDGQTITLNAGDIDAQVSGFLTDSTNKNSKATFNSSKRVFANGSNEPIAENSKWLPNLVSIMKAYPSSRLRIQVNNYVFEGDSTGNAKTNSNKMAYNLKRVFLNKGINDIRIDPVGKTINQKPSNDQLNKQVEVTFFKK